jgi:DNA helicase TIP49 (TBP-interacting protein)
MYSEGYASELRLVSLSEHKAEFLGTKIRRIIGVKIFENLDLA